MLSVFSCKMFELKHKFELIVGLYLTTSLFIFYKVNKTSQVVIDEEFHLRQGEYYCFGRFDVWDEKITTFPGLYIISAILLPLNYCSTFYLRFITLISSFVNLYLILKIRQLENKSLFLLEPFGIALLPPLYFFSYLYYTDVTSVTSVLGLFYYWKQNNHKKAVLFGGISILMRQTNIVWIAMMFGTSALDEVARNSYEDQKAEKNIKALILRSFNLLKNQQLLFTCIKNIISNLWGYIFLMISFIFFVIFNGSIVVGDKTAHTASLNIPQIFYFSLFVVIFGPALIINSLRDIYKHIKCYKFIYLFLTIVSIFAVKYNTVVHPYLLADNRHYTFYIWNRFYGKIPYFRYLMIPAYVFSIAFINTIIKDQGINFQLMYFIALFVALAFQKLVDIRYFIIPFIFLRLSAPQLKKKILIFEYIFNIAMNVVTFFIFFTKEIYWQDYNEAQRLIW